MAKRPCTQEVAVQAFARIHGVVSCEAGVLVANKEYPIKVGSVHQGEPQALEEDVKRAVTVLVERHSRMAAVLADGDSQPLVGPQTVGGRGLNSESLPTCLRYLGVYGNRTTLTAIRKSRAETILEESMERSVGAAVGRLAGCFACKTPAKDTTLLGGCPLPFQRALLLTEADMPAEGKDVKPQCDHETGSDPKREKECANVN